jgi:hypothetical protein
VFQVIDKNNYQRTSNIEKEYQINGILYIEACSWNSGQKDQQKNDPGNDFQKRVPKRNFSFAVPAGTLKPQKAYNGYEILPTQHMIALFTKRSAKNIFFMF